jgi:hypothetical protein
MSFLAKLVLGSNQYTVLHAQYEIAQPTGKYNMPTDRPHIGLINITVESSGKNELFDWAISPKVTKNGHIIFYRRDAQSALNTLKFKDTFCVSYKEIFESEGNFPMRITMSLSPRVLELNNSFLEEDWPGFSGTGSDGGSSDSDNEAITSFNPS